SVEDAALMSLNVDLDQVEPREAALGSERIEAPQRDLQGGVPGTSGTDPRGAGVGAGRGDYRHRKLRDAVAVADRASDDFGMAQGVRGERRFESGGASRRRLDRQHPPLRPDFAGERHGPLPETGADIDYDRAGRQKPEDRRMDIGRMQQGMAA